MTAEEARAAARRTIGNVTHLAEQCRDTRGMNLLDDFRRDVTYAVRTLRRSPAFTATAVLTLALGIGATTAVYSAIDAAFFRPLPFPRPEQLVRVPGLPVPIDMRGLIDAADGSAAADSPPLKTRLDLTDLYALRDVFSHVAAHATGGLNLGTGVEPLRVDVTFVTAEFFATLRRDAAFGRVFAPDEARVGGPNVTVLSDRLWRSQFGGDAAIVGRRVTLDEVPYEVVGVMPPDFRFPAQAQLWVPLPVPAPFSIMSAFRNFLPAITVARLAPGVTPEIAADRLNALRRQYGQPQPGSASSTALQAPDPVVPLQRSLIGDRRSALLVLMASAGLVLLIACANAATLLLSRAALRHREIATHAVLGATRGRIVRRLLVESLLIAVAGAALGLVVAAGSLTLLSAVMPPALAGLAPAQIDVRLLVFAMGVTLSTTVAFGLWPAFGGSRVRPGEALARSGRSHTASGRLNRVLVVGQVAVACLLVIGAALMLTSLRSLLTTDLGMRLEDVASARLNLPSASYRDSAALADFIRSAVARLRDAPGVAAAAAINTLPFSQESGIRLRIDAEGSSPRPGEEPLLSAPYLVVSPGYFKTMTIPLLAGRDLAWTDGQAAPVAVVNRTLARRLWPGDEAIGKRFTWLTGARTVVGVVGDARISDPGTTVEPQVYIPIQEQPQSYLSLVARGTGSGDAGPLLAQFREAVRAVDPALPIYAVQPMEGVVADLVAARRTNTLVISVFGLLALALAALGVYGVLAYSVAQRTREIGVRMALGAQRRAVVALVVRQGLTLVAAGVVLGIGAAMATTRYAQGMLYGVTPRDPSTFLAVALLLVGVAVVASYVPARSAARVDPLTTLRQE